MHTDHVTYGLVSSITVRQENWWGGGNAQPSTRHQRRHPESVALEWLCIWSSNSLASLTTQDLLTLGFFAQFGPYHHQKQAGLSQSLLRSAPLRPLGFSPMQSWTPILQVLMCVLGKTTNS